MKILLLAVVSLFLLCCLPKDVWAADSFQFDQSSFFLQTSGQNKISETVIVKNNTDQVLPITLSWKKYENPNRGIDFAELSTKELTLEPFSVQTTQINFSVPDSLRAGDYYGTLAAASGADIKNADFTIRRLGTLSEKIIFDSVSYEDTFLTLYLENQGNVTTAVFGKITTTNFFGQTVDVKTITEFDIKTGEKIAKVSNLPKLLPGPYQSKVELQTGKTKVNQSEVYSFWVEPEYFGLASFAIFLIFLTGIILFVRRKHV